MPNTSPQGRTLIVGPSWVGDMIMAHSLYQRLAAQGQQIDVLAPGWCLALLSRMPEVNTAIPMPVKHGELKLGTRWSLARALKQENYDQSIVLPCSLKSALVPAFAGIPNRIGWLGEQRYGLLTDHRKLDKKAYPMMVHRYVEFAHPAGADRDKNDYPFPKLTSTPEQQVAVRERHQIKHDGKQPILALCPGAAWGTSKQWPAKHHAQLAKSFLKQGWQVWLLGGPNDEEEIQDIIDQAGEHADLYRLAGEVPLIDKVDLLAQSTVAVANDSGLLHMAAAVDTRVIALYGATSPFHTPPLCKRHHVFNLERPCQPCFKPHCQFGHLNCLNDIKPAAVEKAILALKDKI